MRTRSPLLAGDRQSFPALRAAPFQDESSILRAHADEKSVRPFPVARVGLKRAFTFHGES